MRCRLKFVAKVIVGFIALFHLPLIVIIFMGVHSKYHIPKQTSRAPQRTLEPPTSSASTELTFVANNTAKESSDQIIVPRTSSSANFTRSKPKNDDTLSTVNANFTRSKPKSDDTLSTVNANFTRSKPKNDDTLSTVRKAISHGPFSENDLLEIEKDLKVRRQNVRHVCDKLNLSNLELYPWEFMVSLKDELTWCNVFKSGSTSWAFIFNQLAGYSLDFLEKNREPAITLARAKFSRPSKTQLQYALKRTYSFVVARHPFERLASGYHDKISHPKKNSLHDKLGIDIIEKYRLNGKRMNILEKRLHIKPTFSEFVRYILDEVAEEKELDMHWATVHDFCSVCQANFKVIAKFETFDRDMKYLLQKSGNFDKVQMKKLNISPSKEEKGKEDWHQLFADLEDDLLTKLCELYKNDFLIFQYTWKDCQFTI